MACWLALSLVALCIAPVLFVGPTPVIELPPLPWMLWNDVSDTYLAYFSFLGGAFTHTLLLMLGGAVAGCAALLSFARSMVRASALTSVLSIILFWSAFVSFTQAVSVEGVVFFAYDYEGFVPFTWLVSRAFNALLLTLGGILLLLSRPRRFLLKPVSIVSIFFFCGALSLVVLWLSANFPLPQTVFPDQFLKRPLDVPTLTALFFCLFVIYPRVHRNYNTHFSFALWLSLIPLIAAQLYLMFGSVYIFDDVFNVAYLMKTVAFGVMFGGLVWDYARSSSEEQRLLETVRNREARIRTMFNTASEAIVAVDEKGQIELWNPAAAQLFGWSRAEAIGKNLLSLLVPEESRPQILEHLQRLTPLAGTDSLKTGAQNPERPPLELVLHTREGHLRIVSFSIAPSSREEHSGYTIFARDVTERKQLEQQMMQMDRMVTIGTMAAGVGHELKNPLTYVVSSLELSNELLCEEEFDREELRENLDAATLGAEKIRTILEDLKLLSGFQETPLHRTDLAKAAQVALRMTRIQIQRQALLVEEVEEDLFALADERRLTQVLINLILNASHAMKTEEKNGNRIALRLFADEEYAIIEVSDNGRGVAPELQERIFEPFFTTKAPGEGSGLGLSLSRQIVESFAGTLTLQSTPGEGATFRIALPRIP